MIKPLKRKQEYFVTTEDNALDLVDDLREAEDGKYITGQQVQFKSNKNGNYYRVVVEYAFNTPAGIMESDEYLSAVQEDEDEIENQTTEDDE
ncbi:hypothetical protein ITR00_06300 [Pediococcus pentosaceus]|jgi:hypothetical protein|uniref:hypothetical protein n=1 Tax=Pediococcus pentosaceus TaxID=1255 RepID=UPI0011B45D41|nr:hypothetical protein [Pediococcus pentosaceus]MBF7125671.1 hypothetical protein [Pediococcus pentosaceus]QDZ69532.1 hypothetical protein PSL001_00805 [Pediococcus pentosaceus]WPK17277.1 hypothetical protein R6U75_03815 [Pediococcus pentosaceus]